VPPPRNGRRDAARGPLWEKFSVVHKMYKEWKNSRRNA